MTTPNGKNVGNGNGKGRGRNEKVTDEKRAWLWSRWMETRSESAIATEPFPGTGRTICRKTIHRVRLEDDWDRRLEGIRAAAQRHDDELAARDKATLLGATRAIASGVVKKLVDEKGNLLSEGKVTDFVALARLMRELLGEPTDRIEVHVKSAIEQFFEVVADGINQAVTSATEREAALGIIMGGFSRLRLTRRDTDQT